ncbi:acyltransferase family protein [Bacillus sp. JJ1609]|uniref:acyltransferase family protein n=1 Tax=Bacillus sp. JJ1609 TaxID=3122977 RepID=UPI002FFFA4C1
MGKERLFFLDNLKIFLTILVVVHHVGQPYGGSNGFWYYNSEDYFNLGRFFSVNAGFFMSLFFLISAYFLPASFRKKGTKTFLKDRFIRLGVPLLFGFLVIMPVLMYFYYINFRQYGNITFLDYFFSIYLGFGEMPDGWTGPVFPDMQFGHLWFIEHLLIYALLYVLFSRLLKGRISFSFLEDLNNIKLFLITVIVSIITFAVRIKYPIDHWEGLLGIIQVEYAHLPQYASFFILGTLAFKYKWWDKMTVRLGGPWLAVGVVLAAARYRTNIVPYSQGGFNSINLVYSFFETFLCFGLGFGLIFLFKMALNKTSSFMRILADNSFAVYIFHLPMAVLMQYLFTSIDLAPFMKFIVVSIVTIIATFLFSILIRRFNVVRAIL